MMKCYKIIILYRILFFVCFIFCFEETKAQSVLSLADTAFSYGKYQQAINLYRQFLLNKVSTGPDAETLGRCYRNSGKSYQALLQTDSALYFYNKALPFYRSLKSTYDIAGVHLDICATHTQAREKNLKWTKPTILKETLEEVYFKISSITYYGKDSITIEINAGSYDGVLKGIDAQCLGAIKKDKTTERTGWILASAKVATVFENKTILKARLYNSDDSLRRVFVGDIAALYCKYNKNETASLFQELTKLNICMLDNYRTQMYEWREFLDADSLYENDIYEILKNEVHEIYEMFKDDIEYDALVCTEGLFKGEKLFGALKASGSKDIRAFLQFVKHYPGKYAGMYYKFAETYATWIINNCPSAPGAMTDYYLQQHDRLKKTDYIKNYAKEILKDNYFDEWKNETLKKIRQNNLADIPQCLQMLKDASYLLSSEKYRSWYHYCSAKYFQKIKDTAQANNNFRNALQGFTELKMTEGIFLCDEALKQKNTNQKIDIVLQNGHSGYFSLKFSPDGKYFVTAGNDFVLKLWDARLGKEIMSVNAHDDFVTSASFSYDGRFIISSGLDKTVKLWDADNLSLIHSFHTGIPNSNVIIARNAETFIVSGKDSVIQYWSITEKKLLKRFSKHTKRVYDICIGFNENEFYSCGADSFIYRWDIAKNETVRWFSEKDRIIHVMISPDGRWMCNTLANGKLDVWDLNTNKSVYFFDNLKSYTANDSAGSFYICEPTFSNDSRYLIYGSQNSRLCIMELVTGSYFTYNTSHLLDLMEIVMSADGSFFATVGKDFKINLFDFQHYVFHSKFKFRTIRIEGYTDGGGTLCFHNNKLLINGTSLRNYDMVTGKSETLVDYTNSATGIKTVYDSDKKNIVFVDYYHKNVFKWNLANKTLDTIYTVTTPFKIMEMDYDHASNRLYLYLTNDRLLKVQNKRVLLDIKTNLTDSVNKGLLWHKLSGNIFVAGYNTLSVYSTELELKKTITNFSDTNSFLATTQSGMYFLRVGEKNTIDILNGEGDKINSISIVTAAETMVFSITMSPNDSILVAGMDNGEVYVYDWQHKHLIKRIKNHTMFVMSVAISENSNYLATSSIDSRIILYNLHDVTPLATLYPMYDRGILTITDSNYYLAPRNCYDGFVFKLNKQIYTPEQFDLHFHRPDLVVKKIGCADNEMVRAYNAAYLKRAKRSGLDANETSLHLQLPLLEIMNKENLPITTTQDSIRLRIKASDLQYNIKALRVWANNIPVYGVKGLALTPSPDIEKDVWITLQSGRNSIKIAAVNDRGTESLKEYYEIVCNYTNAASKPKTYLIVISVSRYKDAKYNLTYAAKDGRDLINTFNTKYNNLVIDSFINENATREKIILVKQKLQRTTVNDRVIVFVSGHGLLDKKLNFYFATHDVNFKQPELRGISYEQINELLDEIPARQKLLLMDACHSGEIDRDTEVAGLVAAADSTISAKQDYARKGGELLDDSKVGLQNSFELMQDLFSDLSSGNGAVVISAASGTGYALESDAWQNGVFTYSIINGLKNRKADADRDYIIKISELSYYISKEVQLQTKGNQKPTSRAENLEYDWEIW